MFFYKSAKKNKPTTNNLLKNQLKDPSEIKNAPSSTNDEDSKVSNINNWQNENNWNIDNTCPGMQPPGEVKSSHIVQVMAFFEAPLNILVYARAIPVLKKTDPGLRLKTAISLRMLKGSGLKTLVF